MDESSLLGFWEYDTRAWEASGLFFGAGGEGVYEWARPGVVRGAVFTWRLDGHRLTTRTVRQFSASNRLGPITRGGGEPFDLRNWSVSIAEEEVFARGRQRVFRVPSPGSGARGPKPFEFMRPRCPDDLWEQIRRAHRYFDPRGGLPPPRAD
jgi:hypothetical protein